MWILIQEVMFGSIWASRHGEGEHSAASSAAFLPFVDSQQVLRTRTALANNPGRKYILTKQLTREDLSSLIFMLYLWYFPSLIHPGWMTDGKKKKKKTCEKLPQEKALWKALQRRQRNPGKHNCAGLGGRRELAVRTRGVGARGSVPVTHGTVQDRWFWGSKRRRRVWLAACSNATPQKRLFGNSMKQAAHGNSAHYRTCWPGGGTSRWVASRTDLLSARPSLSADSWLLCGRYSF